MNEVKVIDSYQTEDTFHIGYEMGSKSVPGSVYTLTGDLGVGKTVFTQGFAKGLGIEEGVNSPTFTIVQQYDSVRMPFYHFDVYRIGDIEEMNEIGYEDCIYGNGACLIEWADLIKDILPEWITEIKIEKDLDRGFDYRKITVTQHV